MNVKTTVVLALALCVVIAGYLIFRPAGPVAPQDTPDETEKKAKPLYELADLVKFEIERPGKPKLVFDKPLKEGKKDQYEDWRLVEPVKAKATNWEVRSFADKFKAPKSKETFTPGQGGFPAADRIGLATPKAVVTVTDKNGASRKIEVGDRVFGSDETYIRVAGEAKACVADLDVRDDLKKDLEKFRSKDLLDFDKSKATQVEIEHDSKRYLLVKGEANKWVVDQPIKAAADKSKVDSLLSNIRNLRAETFLEDAPKSLTALGLDKPKTTVTVTIEDKVEEKKKEEEEDKAETPTTTQAAEEKPKFKIVKTTHTVLIGGPSDLKGEKFYCKLGDQPWVVSITKSSRDNLEPKLDDWRDKKLTQAKVLNAEKIDLTVEGQHLSLEKKNGSWRIVKPKPGKAEQTAVSDLLNALRDLTASGWEDGPKDKKAYGLDKPRAEIVLGIKGATTAERFLVGGNTKSGLLTYVHQAASPSIAVVKLDDAKKLLAPALSYRDRSIMTFAKARADQIELTKAGTTIVLAKQKDAWKMTQPVSADADADAVNDLLGDLSSLKASQIAGEGDLVKFGLDKPELLKLTVRVQPEPKPKPKPASKPTTTTAAATQATTRAATKPATQPMVASKPATQSAVASKPATKPAPEKPRKPKTHVLLVAKKGDKVYAALPKGKLIYELSTSVYDNLAAELHQRKPIEFETSKVVSVNVAGGEKPLEFARKDDTWSYVPDPHLSIDEKKVKDMLTGLHDLKAERFLSYTAKDLKPFGLDAPDLTVTITLEDKKTITMILAKPDKDGRRNATIKAEPGTMKVFIATKSDVEKFAKKISDFVKS